MVMQSGHMKLLTADFFTLAKNTNHPYDLLISQCDTEGVLTKILEEKGVKILRPFKVIGMSTLDGDEWKFRVDTEGGGSIKARYVIAADGSHSVVSC